MIAYLRVHGINKEATDKILSNEWDCPEVQYFSMCMFQYT